MYAVHAGNGSLKWVFKTGDAVHSTPAIDDQAVYCGSFDGYCYAISIDNGALLWKFKTVGHHYFPKGEVQGSPAQTEDLVFFGVRDYNVYALDKKEVIVIGINLSAKAGCCHLLLLIPYCIWQGRMNVSLPR
ncbi:MAG: PQQ-like beta-propeller repeat protein [Bacteroidetes bacterium]|nr:PQQ-like beta-propeller repeat protein [Bacteroidota bacterium]